MDGKIWQLISRYQNVRHEKCGDTFRVFVNFREVFEFEGPNASINSTKRFNSCVDYASGGWKNY
jgi:hypothetical protein